MNRCFKPIFVAAIFAVFGVVNAQNAVPAVAPAVTPVAASTATPEVAPVVQVPDSSTTASEVVPATTAVPVADSVATKTVVPEVAPATPVAASVAVPTTVAAKDSAVKPEVKDSIIIIVPEKKGKKKRRPHRTPKNSIEIDVPANFEIQARKVMPIDSDFGDNNMDDWWGRANLQILAESENFTGKMHLRMYPGEFKTSNPDATGAKPDLFQLYEAWAQHRSEYVNVKLGRWVNNARFGSMAFGGYLDAKKDNVRGDLQERCEQIEKCDYSSINKRVAGFMSSYDPENALQFGLNNFAENMSLDIALISKDEHLNRGDLRIYFKYDDIASINGLDFGVGYRSNIFDEIYSKYSDVTHNVDFALSVPIAKDVGFLKAFSIFTEVGLVGINDYLGGEYDGKSTRLDGGKADKDYPDVPMLGGLDFAFYRGMDRVVVEAEYDWDRKKANGQEGKAVQGSIYMQKKLNDRFTLNLGLQSENATKDFSFAGRLQGRIN